MLAFAFDLFGLLTRTLDRQAVLRFDAVLLTAAFFAVVTTVFASRRARNERRLRQEAEEARTEREVLFERSDALIAVADMEGRFLDVNPAWTEALGWSRHELTGRPYLEFVHPDDRAATEKAAEGLAAGRPAVDFHNRYRTARGDYRWIRWRSIPDLEHGRVYAIARDVTVEREEHARLVRSHARLRMFRRLIDETNDAVFVVDPVSGRFVDVNETACRRLGYTRAELLRRGPGDIDPDVGTPEALAAFFDRLERKGRLVVETWHRRKEGAAFPVELALRRVGFGPRAYIVAVARDIIRRKEAEGALESLHHENRMFRAAMDHAQDVVFLLDPRSFTYVDGNAQAYEGLGVSRDEFIGAHPAEFDPAWTPERIETARKRLEEDGRFVMEKEKPTPGGGHLLMELVLDLVEIDGTPFVVGVARDITERETTEAALRTAVAHEKTFRKALDHASDYVFMIDAKTGLYVDVNAPLLEALGTDRESFIGTRPEAWHAAWSDEVVRGAADALDEGREVVFESTLPTEEGLVPVEASFNRVRIGGEDILIGVARDISERKAAERKLEEKHQALKEAEAFRMQLIDSVAHDIAQPLSPLMLQVDLLPAMIDRDPERAKDRVGMLQRNIRRLHRLASDMLEFGRMQSDRFDIREMHVDLSEVAQQIVDDLGPLARQKGVRLETDLHPAPIMGDPDRLTQVFSNLVTNAVKFSPKEPCAVRVEVAPADDHVVARVVDHGRGLTEEEIGRLFRPFTQVHERHETKDIGMGLGLYITKTIVEAHGGEIWAESGGHGSGATFVFRIPMRQDA